VAVVVAVGLSAELSADVVKVTCESTSDKYRYCSAKTDNEVRMLQQLSDARCDQGTSWGYDKNGVWVDHNCAAEFEVGRSGPSTSAKIAAGAAAGAAVLQAFLAGSQPSGTAAPPAAPAAPAAAAGTVVAGPVGTFQAMHPKTEQQVYVTIDAQGLIEGRANEQQFFGRVKGDQIFVGSDVFGYERRADGLFVFRPGKQSEGVLMTPVAAQ
jgi:Protein of unknown function (DUF3011)